MEIRRNAGFTIIELVVVIVVIGILAAVALPRFLSLQDRAHDAVVEGTQAALASGVVMAQSVWLAEGRDSALDDILVKKEITTTCVGGTTDTAGAAVCPAVATTALPVSLDANLAGFPVSHTFYNGAGNGNPHANADTTITGAIQTIDAKGCQEVFEFLLSESSVKATDTTPAEASTADSAFEFLSTTGSSASECHYEYLVDIADNLDVSRPRTIIYNFSNGRVTVTNLSASGETST